MSGRFIYPYSGSGSSVKSCRLPFAFCIDIEHSQSAHNYFCSCTSFSAVPQHHFNIPPNMNKTMILDLFVSMSSHRDRPSR